MGAAASEEVDDSQKDSGREDEELQAEPTPSGGGYGDAAWQRLHSVPVPQGMGQGGSAALPRPQSSLEHQRMSQGDGASAMGNKDQDRGSDAEHGDEDFGQSRTLEEAIKRQLSAVQAKGAEIVEGGRECISLATDYAKKATMKVVTDQTSQVVAASGLGGAVVAGVGGASVGLFSGGALGAAVGLLPALFTCGISIPCGAVIGAAAGTLLGAATGGAVGVTGGSALGYAVYKKGGDVRRFWVTVVSSPFALDHASLLVADRTNLWEVYNVDGDKLGEGAFGSVCRATHRETKQERAIKTMAAPQSKGSEDRIRLEINIMKEMNHPNVLKLHEVYEDDRNIFWVLELAPGGDLFDRIIEGGSFSEKQAAVLTRQIVDAANYLHKKMICHRDLKPENFLLTSEDVTGDQTCLKVIDFGLACRFQPGQELTSLVGTPEYVAPQVLQGIYDQRCDMWSVGVILYILLSGRKPFAGTDFAEVCKEVLRGNFAFELPEWKDVSEGAKHLITCLLRVRPEERCSAEQALEHEWVKDPTRTAMEEVPLREGFIANLQQLAAQSKLKKVALYVIASQLYEHQIKELRETFVARYSNGDGSLPFQGFEDGLLRVKELKVSLDRAGFDPAISLLEGSTQGINWAEFISAAVEQQNQIRLDVCGQVAHASGEDSGGKISAAELRQVIVDRDAQAVDTLRLCHEVDTSGDHQIDFNEFMERMRRPPARRGV